LFNGILTVSSLTQASLLAVDVAEQALARPSETARLSHVNFDALQVPKQWPSKAFDLIVLSEVLGIFAQVTCLTQGKSIRLSLEVRCLFSAPVVGGYLRKVIKQAIFFARWLYILEVGF